MATKRERRDTLTVAMQANIDDAAARLTALDTAIAATTADITATGTITFTTSNRAAGREVTLVIAAGGSSRTLAWPSWTAVGAALPTTLASGKTLVATVTFTSTTDATGIAAVAVQA